MPQPAMDTAAFTEMKSIMGDAFREVVQMCLQTLPEQLEAIESAIETRDSEALFNVCHKLKSSSGSIGAYGLAEKAQVVEQIGRNGSSDVPQQAIDELRVAISQVTDILNSELN
jgi:HPt (histidine-containing phosphotransfer) domain-containing protein